MWKKKFLLFSEKGTPLEIKLSFFVFVFKIRLINLKLELIQYWFINRNNRNKELQRNGVQTTLITLKVELWTGTLDDLLPQYERIRYTELHQWSKSTFPVGVCVYIQWSYTRMYRLRMPIIAFRKLQETRIWLLQLQKVQIYKYVYRYIVRICIYILWIYSFCGNFFLFLLYMMQWQWDLKMLTWLPMALNTCMYWGGVVGWGGIIWRESTHMDIEACLLWICIFRDCFALEI